MSQHPHRPQATPTVSLADLEPLSREALVDLWRVLYQAEPPPRLRRPLLELACGWAIQAETQGGLSPAARRRLQAGSEQHPRRRVKPGTRLVREWHGTVHVIEATSQGFRWQNRTYASLSAIAKAITGANWSGPRFFGLKGG